MTMTTTCQEAREKLDDYLDGLLSEADFQEVELHIGSCPGCLEEERALRRIVTAAQTLPAEKTPPHELWSGIESRLAPRTRTVLSPLRRRPWTGALLAAAAVVLLALGTLVDPPNRDRGDVDRTRVAQPVALALDSQHYTRAVDELLVAVEARRASLPPESRKIVDDNLRVIDQALGEIENALREDPSNVHLARMLNATHRRKVTLLQTLMKLSVQL